MNSQEMKMINSFVRYFMICTAAIIIAGCSSNKSCTKSADHFYLNPLKSPTTVGKVAIVELKNNSTYPQITGDVTDALYHAIQQRQLFGLTIVHQNDAIWKSLQFENDASYDLNQLSVLAKQLNCDAILTGTITEFKPYPHMTIALRMKLIDLNDSQLIWALDQVWDGSDKALENRAEDYFNKQKREGFMPAKEQLIIMSQIEFLKFVAFETAQTLKK
jgi:hypothetical protein